jgi:hypothetical protein
MELKEYIALFNIDGAVATAATAAAADAGHET